MAQSFLKGTLILTIATLLSKLLGSFFRVPLQNIAGDEVLGIFSIVYPIYMVALTLSVAGIPVAISKLISEARAANDLAYVQHLKNTASKLAIIFGVLAFSIVFLAAKPLSIYLGSSETYLAIIFVSFTLLIAPYMAVYRGYFQGHENMTHTGVSQVLEQFVRVFFILAIAWWFVQAEYSDEVVAGGVMAASIIGALASLAYLLIRYRKHPKVGSNSEDKKSWSFLDTSKKILLISLPISIGAITMALFNVVDSVTVPRSLVSTGLSGSEVTYQYGIFGRGLALVQIATVFSTAVVLSLIPLISKLRAKGEDDKAKKTLEKIFAYTHLLSWPIGAGLFVLTVGVNVSLFTNNEGSSVLSILNISSIFTALAVLSTGVLQSLNKASKAAILVLFAVLAKVVANVLLINEFGLMGAAYATVIVYLLLWIVNMWAINQIMPFKLLTRSFVLSIVGSFIMVAILSGLLAVVGWNLDNRWITLGMTSIWTIIGAIIYLAILLVGKDPYVLEVMRHPRLNKFVPSSKSGVKSVKKFTSLLLLVIAFVLVIPGNVQRHQIEWENDQYEIVMPFDELYTLSQEDEEWPLDRILTNLGQSGLDGVSLEPETLSTLRQKGSVTILSTERVNELSLLSSEFSRLAEQVEVDGLFIHIHEQNSVTSKLKDILNVEKVLSANNREFLFISEPEKRIQSMPLAYAEESIESITTAGLTVIPRITNYTIENNPLALQQLNDLSKNSSILFSGTEVLGHGDPMNLNKAAARWKENKTNIYAIEFADQKSFKLLAEKMDEQVVRLHSIDLADIDGRHVAVDRSVRAIKERNIRTLFVRPALGEVSESIPETSLYLNEVQGTTPVFYQDGSPENFTDVSKWTIYLGLLASVIFTFFGVQKLFQRRMLSLVASLGVVAVAGVYAITNNVLFLQMIGLGLSLLTPIAAIYPFHATTNMKKVLLKYLEIIFISAVGIAVMVSVLNGNEFFLKLEEFRGVKLVYIVPLVFAFVYALYGHILTMLKKEIKYWHILVIGAIGVVGLYYLIRSGNAAPVSAYELLIRQKLEELMYVRPRTKEFLIGFPFLVLALYLSKYSLTWAKYMLIPASIGTLSVVNTFTHFHIPLHVSILRSVYSVVLGLLIGLVLIFLFERGKSLFESKIKPRWNK